LAWAYWAAVNRLVMVQPHSGQAPVATYTSLPLDVVRVHWKVTGVVWWGSSL
jgi:hypothetical protein